MHLSTNSPDPRQYSLDTSNFPRLSMVEPYLLAPSQSPPQSSPNHHHSVVTTSPPSVPTFETHRLPPLNPSFHSPFTATATAAHVHQPISHTFVTLLPNHSSSTALNPQIATPVSFPIVANVATTQYYHTESPLVHATPAPVSAPTDLSLTPSNTNTPPSNEPVFVSLPALTASVSAPLPYVTLPGASNSFPPDIPSVTPQPVPCTTKTSVTKTRPKQKKRVSSAKRSRAKPAAPNPTQNVSAVSSGGMSSTGVASPNMPSVTNEQKTSARGQRIRQSIAEGAPREASSLLSEPRQNRSLPSSSQLEAQISKKGGSRIERMPSRSTSARQNMTFRAPEPRQERPGLNFADVALGSPGYHIDKTSPRPSHWVDALQALQRVTSRRDPAADCDGARTCKEAREGPDDCEDADPRLAPVMPLRENAPDGMMIGRASGLDGIKCMSRHKSVAERCGQSPRNGQIAFGAMKDGKYESAESCIGKTKDVSCSRSATAPQESQEGTGERNIPLTGYRGTSNFGRDYHCVTSAANERDGAALESGDKTLHGTKSNSAIQTLRIAGGLGSSGRAGPHQENVERAAECLMTLAGTALPHELGLRIDESRRQAGLGHGDSSSMTQEEIGIGQKSKRGAHLKDAHSYNGSKDKRDCGIQMQNNFGNLLHEQHLQSSKCELVQPNCVQRANAVTIPKPQPTSTAEAHHPAQRRPVAATMPSQRTPAEYTESTPVDIRDARDLFTRLPTTTLPQVSRNRSLDQANGLFENCLTTPEQLREQVIPHPPRASPDVANSLPHPTQVARPLFQEQDYILSSSNPPQSHHTFIPPQHQANHSDNHQMMHHSTSLPQTFQDLYPMHRSSNLSAPHHQLQSRTIISPQSPLPPVSLQISDTARKQGGVSQTKKALAKNRALLETATPSKATRPAKGTFAPASTKIAKPKRPRQPATASLHVTTGATAGIANSTPAANASPQIMLPPLRTPDSNTRTAPSLRLRTNHTFTCAAVPPAADSLPAGAKNLDQQAMQQLPSNNAQVKDSAVRNVPPSWTQAHTAPAGAVGRKPRLVQPRTAAPATSKKTKSANPRPRKTPVKKRGAASERALKAAGSKQNVQNISKARVVKSQSQQIVNLRGPLPPAPLRTVTQRTGGAILDYTTSMQQNKAQETSNVQLREDGSIRAPTDPVKDPVLAKMLSEMKAQTRNISTNPLQVSTERSGAGPHASSPRTESTQQTLHLDTSSDAENPSESDDIPLAQTKKRARASSSMTRRAPDATPAAVTPKPRGQGTSQQPSSTVPTRTATDAVLGCTTLPATQVRAGKSHLLSSRKRQNSSKTTDGNKRRKKNSSNLTEQKSSMSREVPQEDKGSVHVREDATNDAAILCQDIVAEPNRTASAKKSGVRGKTKGRTGRHSTHVRKRASSSAKTQAKERSKLNSSQPNETGTPQTANCTSNLRLCLSVQEKDVRTSSPTEARPFDASCGSPVTPDSQPTVLRDTSKSPQKTGSRSRKESVETGSSYDDKSIQAAPCFAEELRNLHVSGILKASEGTSNLSISESLASALAKTQEVLCVLCQNRGSHNEMVKHPCFPVKAFDVCKKCSHIISKRMEEHGAKRKNAVVSSKESIMQRTTLFVMLIEEMVRQFSPTDRKHRDVERIYDFIKTRNWTEMIERAESLSIHLDMLTVLRVTLRKVGFSVRNGKLRWPVGDFSLPTFADTCALVSHAVPARIEDFRKGILPGEAAWNHTFGEHAKLSIQSTSCAMYEKLFGLIGLKLLHVTKCKEDDSISGVCKVKFEAVSIGVLMYRTSAMLSGSVTRELLAACWSKDEAFRYIDEMEIEAHNESFNGAPKSCCICGGSEKPCKESCSFSFLNCVECSKSFCSICLLNVLGTSEYLRSFGDSGYCCMMCRFQKNAEICPNGKSKTSEQDRRMRLHSLGGIKKRSEKRIRSMPPLLLLSPSVRADILLRLQSSESRKALGVAKFCEVANYNTVRNAMGSQCVQESHNVCLGCKLPMDGAEQDGNDGEVLSCGYQGCTNVMHRNCLAPQRQARRRGSRSKWLCPHHQCSKCEQRDESKLLRCRTCPTTYCKEHMPLPSEIYLFSEKSFACSSCRSFLRVPQMLRLKPQGSKLERKRNHIAQALAIDQRKRSAAVQKLSKGPGCFEAASSSFSEFRRELELK